MTTPLLKVCLDDFMASGPCTSIRIQSRFARYNGDGVVVTRGELKKEQIWNLRRAISLEPNPVIRRLYKDELNRIIGPTCLVWSDRRGSKR